ncbi:MAG: prepilin-type N-terminal cleavage/methylation domain-containing protein [Mariniblastus sp.]|jgi:prepilin-type N-terminal cleavage/methylation domain-containing protein
MSRTSRHSRRGLSMFEMLVSISVSGILFLVAVGWLHQTLKYSSVTAERNRHHQSLKSLAWKLRDDVRLGSSIEMDSENQLVVNFANGDSMTYSITGTIVRCDQHVSKSTNKSASQRTLPVEFKLSSKSMPAWDVTQMPESILLVVYRRDPVDAQMTRTEFEQSTTFREMPIDLHVRVSPNRWKTELSARLSADPTESRERP